MRLTRKRISTVITCVLAIAFSQAQIAFAQGLADDSVAFLEAALELEPHNPDAGRMLQGVQQLAA